LIIELARSHQKKFNTQAQGQTFYKKKGVHKKKNQSTFSERRKFAQRRASEEELCRLQGNNNTNK
jgi:hypothetical protein